MAQYELGLRDYWQVLKKRRMVVVLTFVFIVAATYYYTKSQPRLYKAVAIIRVVERKTMTMLLTELLSPTYATPIESYVRAAKGRPVLERVIRELNLLPADATAEELNEQVSVLHGIIRTERIPQTDFIRIKVVYSDPEQAAQIANKTAEAFKIENLLENNKQARKLREFVESQLQETKRRLKQIEDRMQELKVKQGATGLAIPLMDEIAALQSERANLLRKYTTRHPTIVAIDEQLEALKKKMKNISDKELQFARLTRELDLSDRTYRTLQEKFNEAQIAEAEKVSDVSIVDLALTPTSPFKPRVRLNLSLGITMGLVLGLALAFMVEQMDTSLGTIEDIESTLKIRVLSVVPYLESRPDSRGGVFGRLPFNLIRRKNTIEQLRSQVIINYSNKSPAVEAYRMLYTNLNLEGFGGVIKNKVVQFTSAGPEEGKSITIVNLAFTLAQEGLKTLLIDTDLRRAVIHKLFGFDKAPGFTDVILGTGNLLDAAKNITDILIGRRLNAERLVHMPGMDNLYILTSGTSVSNITQLLNSRELTVFFDSVRRNYDVALLDSPPVLAVSDPVMIASQMDGVVLVYKVGKTAKDAILRTKVQLQGVKSQIKGIILNSISPDVKLYSTYYYPYRYYGAREKKKA